MFLQLIKHVANIIATTKVPNQRPGVMWIVTNSKQKTDTDIMMKTISGS